VKTVDVGKEPGSPGPTQGMILSLLAHHALAGSSVVRLKGGDPFVYGRGGEEWEYLSRRGIPVTVIPGVSSALAVPALAGIPLTHRGVAASFAVVTGHLAEGPNRGWDDYTGIDTLVVLMGVSRRRRIASALVAAGRPPDEPAAFIQSGSRPDEVVSITTLREIAADGVSVASPAVLVVGRVVSIRGRLDAGQARLSARRSSRGA
ncbi:MAG: uroporphyrinogen-III C-methyltransferase, partial [Actinomycetota bacterium]